MTAGWAWIFTPTTNLIGSDDWVALAHLPFSSSPHVLRLHTGGSHLLSVILESVTKCGPRRFADQRSDTSYRPAEWEHSPR